MLKRKFNVVFPEENNKTSKISKLEPKLVGPQSFTYKQVIEKLTNEGLNVNAKYENNNTLMHYTAEKGHLTTMKEILKRNGNVHDLNDEGHLPLFYALQNNHKSTTMMLFSYSGICSIILDNGILEMLKSKHIKNNSVQWLLEFLTAMNHYSKHIITTKMLKAHNIIITP